MLTLHFTPIDVRWVLFKSRLYTFTLKFPYVLTLLFSELLLLVLLSLLTYLNV